MKEMLVEELKEGDIFYFDDSYFEAIRHLFYYLEVKCIMSPSDNYVNIMHRTLIERSYKVKLLIRDGKQV